MKFWGLQGCAVHYYQSATLHSYTFQKTIISVFIIMRTSSLIFHWTACTWELWCLFNFGLHLSVLYSFTRSLKQTLFWTFYLTFKALIHLQVDTSGFTIFYLFCLPGRKFFCHLAYIFLNKDISSLVWTNWRWVYLGWDKFMRWTGRSIFGIRPKIDKTVCKTQL
jgi:hypothetical protein